MSLPERLVACRGQGVEQESTEQSSLGERRGVGPQPPSGRPLAEWALTTQSYLLPQNQRQRNSRQSRSEPWAPPHAQHHYPAAALTLTTMKDTWIQAWTSGKGAYSKEPDNSTAAPSRPRLTAHSVFTETWTQAWTRRHYQTDDHTKLRNAWRLTNSPMYHLIPKAPKFFQHINFICSDSHPRVSSRNTRRHGYYITFIKVSMGNPKIWPIVMRHLFFAFVGQIIRCQSLKRNQK